MRQKGCGIEELKNLPWEFSAEVVLNGQRQSMICRKMKVVKILLHLRVVNATKTANWQRELHDETNVPLLL